MRTRAWRLVGAGILLALAVGVSGRLVERFRLGATDADTLVRVEAALRGRFEADAARLAAVASRVAAERDVVRAAALDPAEKRLFDLVARALPPEQAGRVGVTVYDAASRPIAWAGRVSDVAKALITGSSTLVAIPGALGPRLVHIESVSFTPRGTASAR